MNAALAPLFRAIFARLWVFGPFALVIYFRLNRLRRQLEAVFAGLAAGMDDGPAAQPRGIVAKRAPRLRCVTAAAAVVRHSPPAARVVPDNARRCGSGAGVVWRAYFTRSADPACTGTGAPQGRRSFREFCFRNCPASSRRRSC
ncbi:MAG: hypothetical protein NT133_15535 [Alphaproteobacteria bacterium]|nr:hypothetical protein [Alphaproteobacteria bacterium]